MADKKLSADEILKHFREYERLCPENVIGGSEDENEINLFNPSPYYLIESFVQFGKWRASEHIKLKCIVYKCKIWQYSCSCAQRYNVQFYVICFQKIWLHDTADLSLFQIDGLNCFDQGKALLGTEV